ncbi:hypothetical protein [Listeria ivanovii]|uniref:hypothetical protein n=1 Tax=Listeria ivanovii TaxID=1638 RepID=UPI0005128EDF|nr:hypothetical protein [Listeria ivanovii]AIS61343.1 hypothetical protein JL53_00690 [Listeria ivanovii subsp. londoniensis]
MTIYKKDLYALVEEAKKKKLAKLRQEQENESKLYVQKIVENNDLEAELKEFILCRNKAIELAEKLYEYLPVRYSHLSSASNDTQIPSYEYLIDRLSDLRFAREDNARRLRYKHDSDINAVHQEYAKLKAQLKAISSKQGYEVLKNLGFDVSDINVNAKSNQNQIAIVPLDKNLLGIEVSENERT